MSTPIQPRGPIALRPWWHRALEALLVGMLVQIAVVAAVSRRLPVPWDEGVPMALGLAVVLTYHRDWWRPQWRRAALVQFAALVGLELAVVALSYRLGWWY